jgi:hypothetical protein
MNNAQLSHAQDEYESGIEYDVDYSLVAWLSGEPSFESEAPGMFFDGTCADLFLHSPVLPRGML